MNAFGISTKPGRLMLPKWIKVNEERLNEILITVTETKSNGFKTNVDGREITLDNAESLLKSIGSGKIDRREFKETYNNTVDDVEKILHRPMLKRTENKIVKLLLLLKELVEEPPYEQPDEEPDITDLTELESEESDVLKEESAEGLKMLIANQMLIRLITNFFRSIKSRK